MKNLINFILKYAQWFLFTIYVLISLVLLIVNRNYQQSIYLSSANVVTGSVYGAWSSVTGYFHLKTTNESLQQRNALLQNEVLNLQSEVARLKSIVADSISTPTVERFDYIAASVINNNTRHPRNYFTINRGSLDGVKTGMGVVNQNGVVGIVNVTGPHMARVISLLNETQHFSVKLKDTPFVGSLTWKGDDPEVGYVEEIPRHAKYQIGDTVVTSGYSTAFPEGIPVGIIMNRVRSKDDSFFTFKVRLASDFRTINGVRVIKDIYKQEIDSLATFDIVENQ